jgi:hypothetical protein
VDILETNLEKSKTNVPKKAGSIMDKLIDGMIEVLQEEKRTTLILSELFSIVNLRDAFRKQIKEYILNNSCDCHCHHLNCECESSRECVHCLGF